MKRFGVAMLLVSAVAVGQQSRNEQFTVSVEKIGGAKTYPQSNTWHATITGPNGRVAYRLMKEVPFDTPFPSVVVGENGAAIVENAFHGTVEFYDMRGTLVRTLLPFGKQTTEHEQILKLSTARDRVALLSSSLHRDAAIIALFDLQGNEQWRAQLSGRHAAEVFLSNEADLVAAGSYTFGEQLSSVTQVFNANGTELMSVEGSFRTAAIRGGRIALADRNSIRLFTIGNPAPVYRWQTESPSHIVTNLLLTGSDVVCSVERVEVVNGVPTYRNPTLIVLNAEGKLVVRRELMSSSPSPALLRAEETSIVLKAAGRELRHQRGTR